MVGSQCTGPADQEQDGDEELVVEIEQRQEQAVGPQHGVVVARVIGRQLAKQPGVFILPDEALRHADAQHRFGKRRRHAAERVAHRPQRTAQFAMEEMVDRPERGSQAQHHQKQERVVIQHEDGGDRHLADLHQAHEEHFLHADADVLDIGRHAADDPADLRAVEKAHRHPLQMLKEGDPQVANHRFAQLERITLPVMHHPLRGEREQRKRRSRPTPRRRDRGAEWAR